MSAARTLLIVSSPARDVTSARRDVAVSWAASAELPLELPPRAAGRLKHARRLSEMFPTELPLIATLRSRAQGGEGPDDPADRARILDAAFALPFAFVDYELGRDDPSASHPRGGTRPTARYRPKYGRFIFRRERPVARSCKRSRKTPKVPGSSRSSFRRPSIESGTRSSPCFLSRKPRMG